MGRLDEIDQYTGTESAGDLVAALATRRPDVVATVLRRAAGAAVLHDDRLEIAIDGGSIVIRVVGPASDSDDVTSDRD